MRYVLLLCYDGTEFCGWQKQKRLRTVQGVLEEVSGEIFPEAVTVTASGRTDAGVHAMGQVAQFDAETTIPAEKLRECFNRLLPPDVRVLESAVAQEGFDCTRGAKKKTYIYRAYYAESEIPLLSRYRARLDRKPDTARMRKAAALLIGEHDFAAFRASGFSSKTSVRTVYTAEVSERDRGLYTEYDITVCGNGFLYNMVRIIAGELFAVGYGKEESITSAFRTGERKLLAKTMPPQGLVMEQVEYGVPLFGASGGVKHGVFQMGFGLSGDRLAISIQRRND